MELVEVDSLDETERVGDLVILENKEQQYMGKSRDTALILKDKNE